MIKTEIVAINGKQFLRTYSSNGRKIMRDGVSYIEALDPIDLVRSYVEEGIEDSEDPELSAEEALNIIVNGG